jgi:uncharacterized repeat protein (TIGR01451 family)
VPNAATAAADNEAESDLDNNHDSASVAVNCPDVKVVKTANDGRINAGENAAFTIVVSNVGSGTAHGVTLSDPLPDGVTWSEDSEQCSISSGTLSCSFGDLAPEGTRTIHVSGATSPANCGTLVNTAHAGAVNERQIDGENDSDSATIAVDCPNIALVKTADAPSVKAGQQLGFVLTVSNAGDGTAKDVHVSDPLPTNAGLAFAVDAAHSDGGCAIAAGTLNCSFGDLAHGGAKSVHLVSPTTEATCGTVSNAATADTSNGSPARASAAVAVTCPVIDLAITKVDDPDPLFVNDTLTYTLTVRNNGPDTATAVVVTDSLPSGVTFVSASPSQGGCLGDRVVSCQLGTMAAGATATITVVVRPTVTGTITNTAIVAGHEAESNMANNTASADTLVKGRVAPVACYSLSVRPRTMRAGKWTIVRVAVRLGSRPAAHVPVTLRGAGVAKVARSDKHGIARFRIKTKRAGIIRLSVPSRRACPGQEIGVAGAFKPPAFTG